MFNKYSRFKSLSCLMALALASVAAGCGGGGANVDANATTAADAGANSTTTATTTTVSGTAASGKPINGGTVQMVCANSSAAGAAVITGADGVFAVSAPLDAPCVIRVSGGDIVGGGPLFSVVTSSDQTLANVNQLTTMLAFLLAGGNPDTELFQAPAAISNKVTSSAVIMFKETIRANVIANLSAAVGILPTFDFLEGTFTANHLGFDLLLDKIGFTPGSTVSIMFDGTPILAVNSITGTASTTTSTVISDTTLAAAGLSGAGPSAAGPSGAGPSGAGPSAAGPSDAGPSAAGPSDAGIPNINVTTANMQGWSFINDCGVGTPTGALVTGPASPPLDTGSARLAVNAANECVMLATHAYIGTLLSRLTSMKYSTFQSGPILAIALQFDVRYHPADTVYQGRLVFEPYQNGTVAVGSGWQNWSALDGKWWASKTNAVGSNGLCPQSNPCTWSQILVNWPNASILGNTLFKAGSGWSSFAGNVDAFIIGIDGVNTTYDFE